MIVVCVMGENRLLLCEIFLITTSARAGQQCDPLLLLVEKSLLLNFGLVLSTGVVLTLDRLSVN